MAHIFKKPTKNAKGIIVFTHKEILKKKFYIDEKAIKEKLKKKYFIGMHSGGFIEGFSAPDYVDFILGARESGLLENEEDFFRIPLNSSNFIENFYVPKDNKKEYDIIFVSNHIPSKNILQFLKTMRRLFVVFKKDYRVLLITCKGSPEHFKEIQKYYNNNFTISQKEKITIIANRPYFSREKMVELYSKAKIFAFFSEIEGSAKVVPEALCCGLPVVAYSKLKGGGIENLDKTNSILFDCFDKAPISIINSIKMVSKGEFSLNLDRINNLYKSEYSIEKLHTYFDILYRLSNQEYDRNLINTDNLNFRLPAHYQDVKWKNDKFFTNDLRDKSQWEVFLSEL